MIRVKSKGSRGHSLINQVIHGAATKSVAPGLVVQEVKKGFPFTEIEILQEELDLPMEALARTMHVSRATLHRIKTQRQRLTADQSDKVLRLARLIGIATKVFDSPLAARKWFTSSQIGLGGEWPLDYAETEVGAREVENLLGRIEHGVYT